MRDPASADAMGARARQSVVEKFSLDAEAGRNCEGLPHAGLSHHLGDEGVEIAAREQEAGDAGGRGGLDIASACRRSRKLPARRPASADQVQDHAGRGFAPVEILEIAGDLPSG